jgi:hypothetical protein
VDPDRVGHLGSVAHRLARVRIVHPVGVRPHHGERIVGSVLNAEPISFIKPDEFEECYKNGADEIITKPFSSSVLIDKIEKKTINFLKFAAFK